MSRTSKTHPLYVNIVAATPTPGRIGLTLCPGKVQRNGQSGAWDRDLAADLARIVEVGATTLVSLIEAHEFERLQVPTLPERAQALGLQWWGVPVLDGGVPVGKVEQYYVDVVGPALHRRLQAGELIVVHCMGGLGRAGLLAARLLVELGHDPDEAMREVRAARPGAIETDRQERFIRACATTASPSSSVDASEAVVGA